MPKQTLGMIFWEGVFVFFMCLALIQEIGLRAFLYVVLGFMMVAVIIVVYLLLQERDRRIKKG